MLDVMMESAESEMQEFGPSLSEELILQTFPFSVLVPAALEARNKLPVNKGTVLKEWCVYFYVLKAQCVIFRIYGGIFLWEYTKME